MILRSIRLTNVRRFIEPVEVRGIGPGLNVLAAPNEDGKSTVFDALHAVFFRDRKSWDKRVRSLKPYAGGDPEVEVEIDLDGEVYRISKIWKGTKGSVKISRCGTVFRQADKAEDWIRSVLKAPESGGPAGLLWVRQGQAGLDRGSKKESDSAQLARKNLLASVVSGEVDTLTGGRRMEVARNACREELAQYVTESGKVRKSGPLALKKKRVAALEEQLNDLTNVSNELRNALSQRRRCWSELNTWEDPQKEADRGAKLKAALQADQEARRHADLLERAKVKEHAKRLELTRARERRDALLGNIQELEGARKACATGSRAHLEAVDDLAVKEKALASAEAKRKEAEIQAETARQKLRRAEQKERFAMLDGRRKDLAGRLKRAEEARRALEKAGADEVQELSAPVIEELERQAAHVAMLRRLRDREATALTMTYLPGCEGSVTLKGNALAHNARVSIPEGAVLDIEGVGTLTVHPDQGVDNTSLEKAEKQLRHLFLEHELEDIAGARASRRRRRDAEARRRDAEVLLQGLAPNGIRELRNKLAAMPVDAKEVEDAMPRAEAATLEEQARASRDALATASEQHHSLCLDASNQAARTSGALVGAQSRLSRAQDALKGLDSPDKEASRQAELLKSLSEELQALVFNRTAIEDSAPNMEAVTNRLRRARSALNLARDEKERLRLALGKLDVSIRHRYDGAVEEELEDVKEKLEQAKEVLRNICHEVDVLQCLDLTLKTAQQSARDRYVAPVLQELRPLIRLLWPKAKIRFGADNILPEALEREGTEEDFDVLSGGTQEQIAILVRLAFARILASSGSPAPVIFDDAIVYTDDHRIESMFDALTSQAQDLQIIVLSCRQRAFMELGGNGLRIERVLQQQVVIP